ncbi:complement C1q tumor necrosis factor-related protein 3-like, partial [Panulirus ornatus]|uniref:complement C1q tumor necrosis factor-related protein 3-like n=1 Tax=Panulirus ornatus TaxID=150431 RepID=UPI003A871D43
TSRPSQWCSLWLRLWLQAWEKQTAAVQERAGVVQRLEREETTEKAAPQIYTYRPPSQGGRYPSNASPANNPAYNPSSFYPGIGNGGSAYPYNPVGGSYGTEAFTARRASPFTTAGSRVILTETVTQLGSGWNTANSEFVATYPGVFFFTFSAVSERYTHFRLTLKHNGADVVSAFGDASGYQMGGQGTTLRLNSGDRVYLQLDEGRLYDVTSSRAYTTFSGFRIA